MKSQKTENLRRNLLLTATGLATLLASGCALPSREEWSHVQERGLIPVLIDANRTEVAQNAPVMVKPGALPQLAAGRPSQQEFVQVQPVKVPGGKIPSAESVPGRPGFVYSPYLTPRKVVDVRSFQPGEEVRCPFTREAFVVPYYRTVAETPPPVSKPVEPHVQPSPASTPATVPPLDAGLARLEPPVEPSSTPPVHAVPAPAAPANTPPVKPAATASADGKAAIPYGTRVPGRPGFAYSPHAAKSQLVDVAGYAPGVVVKCPYTNKMFRVPEPVTELIKPEATATASAAPVPGDRKETTPTHNPAPIPPPPPVPVNPGGPALGAPLR
ncbi:MAG TPA: hypothetical protein VHM91_17755 [Verrucomicrobiales bacterium]|nr:hypothetical protein [Verrucomicrobiales bacterium]